MNTDPMTQPPIPSQHKIGNRALFQPALRRIEWIDGAYKTDDSAIPCKVVAVKFNGAKVLYDICMPDGEGGFYEVYPLCNVDSFMVLPLPLEDVQ